MIGQIGACIALGIFFGYVYMKTKNIWIVSILHYTNNNLAIVFTDTNKSSKISNVSLKDILITFAIALFVYGWIIFSKHMKEFQWKKKESL